MKKYKRINLIVIISTIVFLLLGVFGYVYFTFFYHHKGKYKEYNWSSGDSFNISNVLSIDKKENEEFKILNLTDVQICDLDNLNDVEKLHKQITYLVNKTNPDLITLTGDQTWSNENYLSIKRLLQWLDEYKVKFAPIFGNHDYGNSFDSSTASLTYLCDLYENNKYCLFNRGPTNIDSLGNYVINIMENDKVYLSLYMVNTGFYNDDVINDKQIEYFRWNAEGIKNYNNNTYPSSFAFMHKPLPEYYDAYVAFKNNVPGVIANGEVYRYYSLSGTKQNGFFSFCKEVNIDNVVAGHQHGNCFSIKYEDVWLTSALKTGEFGGFIDNNDIYLSGATLIKLSNNKVNIENVFLQKGQF